jgi:O-antigen ligase
VLVIAGAGLVVVLKDNDRVQNILFHTDENSQAKDSSNETRLNAQKAALQEVVQEPLGRGPGTAGPASQHNDGHDVRISENYFLQIGQETGWLGLGLFVGILAVVAKELWQRRRIALLASLFGITFICLVSHAWADDTLALLWWGAAGILLAPAILNKSKKNEAR